MYKNLYVEKEVLDLKTIKFGIIGCGLMGKEFAGAVGRWYHLEDQCAKPEIIAICGAILLNKLPCCDIK